MPPGTQYRIDLHGHLRRLLSLLASPPPSFGGAVMLAAVHNADPVYFRRLMTLRVPFGTAKLKQQPAAPLLKEVELCRTAPTSN